MQASIDVSSLALRHILRQIAEEVRQPGMASGLFIEVLVVQAAISLQRYFAAIEDRPRDGGLSARRLAIIDERPDALANPPGLIELARLCDLSVRQLARGFKASHGVTIGAYVAERRLTVAKRFLAGGDGLKAISYNLGFASPASFSHAFRKAMGTTPGQYRARIRCG